MSQLLESSAYKLKIRPLLDLYDDLRVLLSEEREVKLPSIAVIGKQSAGELRCIGQCLQHFLPVFTLCVALMMHSCSMQGPFVSCIGHGCNTHTHTHIHTYTHRLPLNPSQASRASSSGSADSSSRAAKGWSPSAPCSCS